MYLLKVWSKNIFCLVSILKVADKKSRTGSWIWIGTQVRRTDLDREPYQNFHGSRTLIILNSLSCAQLHFWVVRVKTVVAVSYHPLQAVVGIRDILMRLRIRICWSAPLDKWIRLWIRIRLQLRIHLRIQLQIQLQIRLLSSVTLKGHGNEPDFLFFCINCLQNPAQACWLFDSFTTNLLSNFYLPHCYSGYFVNIHLISWHLQMFADYSPLSTNQLTFKLFPAQVTWLCCLSFLHQLVPG